MRDGFRILMIATILAGAMTGAPALAANRDAGTAAGMIPLTVDQTGSGITKPARRLSEVDFRIAKQPFANRMSRTLARTQLPVRAETCRPKWPYIVLTCVG